MAISAPNIEESTIPTPEFILLPKVETANQELEINAVTREIESESVEQTTKAIQEQQINLDQLNLRQARKLAKSLGIQQKVNGKDAPVKWLRAQIKQRIEEKPELLLTIYVS